MAEATPRLGPLVHRAVHHAATLWLVATVQFVAAMIVVQLYWKGPPAYSLTHNYISDLGNTMASCGVWPTSGVYVCSPWHDVFNASVIVFGVLVILGALLVRSGFPSRTTRTLGLGLFVLLGVGAIGVGLFPENVHWNVHQAVSLLAFVVGNFGLVVLAIAMFRDTRWDGYRSYTLFSGLIGLVALGLFVGKVYGPLGAGGMERLVVAPALLWFVVASVRLLRIPTYAPRIVPKAPGV